MRCYACDHEVELAPGERIGFRDECPSCRGDLHVCCNCAHYDPSAYNECRESSAEWVSGRERANHCDYFTPGRQEGGEAAATASKAQSALEDLFKK